MSRSCSLALGWVGLVGLGWLGWVRFGSVRFGSPGFGIASMEVAWLRSDEEDGLVDLGKAEALGG